MLLFSSIWILTIQIKYNNYYFIKTIFMTLIMINSYYSFLFLRQSWDHFLPEPWTASVQECCLTSLHQFNKVFWPCSTFPFRVSRWPSQRSYWVSVEHLGLPWSWKWSFWIYFCSVTFILNCESGFCFPFILLLLRLPPDGGLRSNIPASVIVSPVLFAWCWLWHS